MAEFALRQALMLKRAGKWPGDGIDPHKRRADDAELHVAQSHLTLEEREDGEDHLPVRVVEEADEPEQTDDDPFIVPAG